PLSVDSSPFLGLATSAHSDERKGAAHPPVLPRRLALQRVAVRRARSDNGGRHIVVLGFSTVLLPNLEGSSAHPIASALTFARIHSPTAQFEFRHKLTGNYSEPESLFQKKVRREAFPPARRGQSCDRGRAGSPAPRRSGHRGRCGRCP